MDKKAQFLFLDILYKLEDETFIDGNPTVFRYDLEMDQLIHEYPEEIPEGMHTIRVFLRDKQGNETSGEWEFEKKD